MNPKSRTSFQTIGSFSIPETNDRLPIIRLPSGHERLIIKTRVIPHMDMVEVTTLPDASDGNVMRMLRVKANTPIVRIFCQPWTPREQAKVA